MSFAQTQSLALPAVTPELIMKYAWGFGPALILEAAVHFRVFDHLEQAPRTAQQVAEACGASERGARGLLNALVGLSLLKKELSDRYSLTPESRAFLVSSNPGFHGGVIRMTGNQVISNWLHLKEVIRTGEPVAAHNQELTGGPFFQDFVADLFAVNYPAAQALAASLLNGIATPFKVLDLAAGSGVWGIAMAQRSRYVRVTAIDWPAVTKVTRQTVARCCLTDRVSVVEGDLSKVAFGIGYQAATLGHILHSEGEARSRELLKKTFTALAPGGTIAIAEWLVDEDRSGPPSSLIFGLNMLVHTEEGDTFSFSEIGNWLKDAGFASVRLLEAPGPFRVILATKPEAERSK